MFVSSLVLRALAVALPYQSPFDRSTSSRLRVNGIWLFLGGHFYTFSELNSLLISVVLLERSQGSFEEAFEDSKQALSHGFKGNGFNIGIIKISFHLIDIREESLVLSCEDVSRNRNVAQYHIDRDERMDSYLRIDQVLAQIDFPNDGDPHGIAIDQKVLRRSNTLFDLNYCRNSLIGKPFGL